MPIGLVNVRTRIALGIAAGLMLPASTTPAGSAATAAVQDASCPAGRPPLTEFGVRQRDGRELMTDLEVELPESPEIRYFRLRFTLERDSGNWSLVVRNFSGRPINILNKTSFGVPGAGGGRARWTDRIGGRFARVDLFRTGAGPGPHIRLDEYLVMAAETRNAYYSYEDENNKKIEPLYANADLDDPRLGDSVGMMFAGRRGLMWACSAVAVSADVVMTSWHCGSPGDADPGDFWSQSICDATIIDFSWDEDDRSREFGCEKVLPPSNAALDVAFLRVRPIDRADVLRPATLLNRSPRAEPVVIVHHPEALPKQITRHCRTVLDAPNIGADLFGHTCDSEGGSSGAPVFDESGRVLGLHREGFLRDERTCERLDSVNKAVRIESIVRWLRRPTTPGGAELLKSLNIEEQ
jgi:V8-like Glu-specific endopeptidase